MQTSFKKKNASRDIKLYPNMYIITQTVDPLELSIEYKENKKDHMTFRINLQCIIPPNPRDIRCQNNIYIYDFHHNNTEFHDVFNSTKSKIVDISVRHAGKDLTHICSAIYTSRCLFRDGAKGFKDFSEGLLHPLYLIQVELDYSLLNEE